MGGRYLPLACYGKLPCWREYLSVRADGGAAASFREWLHAGRAEWLAGHARGEAIDDERLASQSDSRETSSFRFLFHPGKEREMLLGFIRPSQDAGGRTFPFATFVRLPDRIHGKQAGFLPLGFAGTWSALEEISRSFADLANESQFQDAVAGASIEGPLEALAIKAQHASQLGRRPAHLFGAQRSPLAAVEELRALGRQGARVEVSVDARAEGSAIDTAFWLDALDGAFAFRPGLPTFFLDAEPADGRRRLLLLPGSPSIADYRLVFAGEEGRADVARPAGIPESPRRGGAPAATPREGLDASASPPARSPSDARAASCPTQGELLARLASRTSFLHSVISLFR